jgi:predicted anti-sigma-YlaC factor YlaD
MKPCERVDALLSEYLESETSPAETRFIEGHLTVCSRCREQMEEVRVLLQRLARLPRVTASADFTDAVLARTHGLVPAGLEEPVVALHPARRAPQWAAPLAAAAALAVIVLGATQLPWFNPAGPDLARDGAPAVVADAVPDARLEMDRFANPDAGSRAQPEVTRLTELRPDLAATEGGEASALGMASDAYALDDWVLRGPAEGGTPVLTRVDADSSHRVMVTF